MKKNLMILLAATVFIPGYASADYAADNNKRGGFVGDQAVNVVTVGEIENAANDSYVVMEGYITTKTGDEKYTFKDNTGTIQVEIDDDDWNGLTVRPGDKVRIQGEVDKSWTKPTEIEVDTITLSN